VHDIGQLITSLAQSRGVFYWPRLTHGAQVLFIQQCVKRGRYAAGDLLKKLLLRTFCIRMCHDRAESLLVLY